MHNANFLADNKKFGKIKVGGKAHMAEIIE